MLDHDLDADAGILTVRPTEPLTRQDFEALAAAVDPYLEAAAGLKGLMIDAARFPGWADFDGMMSHFRFVRDHHRRIARVAVVSDDPLLSTLPKLARHFVAADIRRFSPAERGAAADWLRFGTT